MVARIGSRHCRTVGGELFTGLGSTHVVLDTTARDCSRQTHIVKLADDAFHLRDVCEVRSALSTRLTTHPPDMEHTGYRRRILRIANESRFSAEIERRW